MDDKPTTINKKQQANSDTASSATAEAVDIVQEVENPDGTTTTTVTEVVTPESVMSSTAPTKKKKTGLIIGIIIAFVILIGGGVTALILWLSYYNSPETVAVDAVSNLFSAEPMATSGHIEYDLGSMGSSYDIESIVADIDTQDDGVLPASTQLSLKVNGEKNDYKLGVSGGVSKDGEIYFKVDHLADTIDAVLSDYSSYFPRQATSVVEQYDDIISQVDGTWYKANLPDLMDKYRDELGLSKKNVKAYRNMYSCVFDTISNTMPSRLGSLGKAYRDHPFLTVKEYKKDKFKAKYGGQLYTFDYKADELLDFLDVAVDNEYLDDIASCMDESGVLDDSSDTVVSGLKDARKEFRKELDKIDADDLEKALDEATKNTLKYAVEIDGNHRIVGFYTEASEGDMSIKASIGLSYGKSDLQLPNDAKSVDDLIDDIVGKLN